MIPYVCVSGGREGKSSCYDVNGEVCLLDDRDQAQASTRWVSLHVNLPEHASRVGWHRDGVIKTMPVDAWRSLSRPSNYAPSTFLDIDHPAWEAVHDNAA